MSSLRSRLFIPNSLFIISAISETDKRKEKREGREGGPIDREGKSRLHNYVYAKKLPSLCVFLSHLL